MGENASIWKTTLMPGIYLALVSILLLVIFYVTGNTFKTWVKYISFLVFILGVIYGQVAHRKALGGTLTYGQAVGSGVVTMLYASVIIGIYTFLLYKVIDPSLTEQLRIFVEQKIVQQGRVPEEQIETAVDMAIKFQKPGIMLIMSIVEGVIIGSVISLITGIFTKRTPSDEVTA